VIEALRPVLSDKLPDPTAEPTEFNAEVRKRLASYLRALSRLRRAIGLLGLLLPVVLVGLDYALFQEKPWLRGSLSAYYYSGVRELFVGILAATGVFLISYRVGEKNLNNWVTIFAGFAAIVIACFPTSPQSSTVALTKIQTLLHERWVTRIHYGATIVFILALGLMSLIFGLQAWHDREGKRRKFLLWFHVACTVGIAVAGGWILVAKFLIHPSPHRYVLIGETLAAVSFGASWLMKGAETDDFLARPPRG
jgi:hypothetical protein